ncbi:MAG TPA: hypothetical protein VE713_19730 [Pyrinomonadaceae bacterium]|nr:hypothetical protein [Pyrinomonadaceae bacterium]
MLRASNIRLPGVYFLPNPPQRGLGLPPLDVAAFVGFAERGPLDWPVAVEDLDSYRAIFGGDLAVARERGGASVYAHTPSAVASFFANGGRRCYVVRVAGRSAQRTLFRLPGLVAFGGALAAGAGAGPWPATAWASSEGRWSEDLRLGARLGATPLPPAAFEVLTPLNVNTAEGPREFDRLGWQTGSAPEAIQAGDLLRLTFEGSAQFLFPVEEARRRAGATAATPVELLSGRVWQLVSPSELRGSPPGIEVASVERLTPAGPSTLGGMTGEVSAAGAGFIFAMTGGDSSGVAPGDVLAIKAGDGEAFLMSVAETGNAKARDGGLRPAAQATQLLRRQPQTLPQTSPPSLKVVERLRFDLFIREGVERRPTVEELSFNEGHPRFWGDTVLVETSSLRRQADGGDSSQPSNTRPAPNASAGGETAAAASAEVFLRLRGDERVDERALARLDPAALAGLLSPVEARGRTYLPLGMPSVVTEEEIVGPEEAAVGRDDLDTFDPALFVDRVLVPNLNTQPPSGASLIGDAFDRYYVQNKRLRGMHSLLFVGEAALLAAPEASQREWERVPQPQPQPPAVPPSPPPPDLSRFEVCTPPSVSPPLTSPPAEAQTPAPPKTVELPVLRDINTDDEEDPQYQRELRNLVRVHHALLNFCEGRRDALGVLALPSYFEKRQCVRWLEEFRTDLGLPRRRAADADDTGDMADLSYIAVYHPWLLLADPNSPDGTRGVPPDGAACGMIAARERAAQVWVAPANVALNGVIGLAPSISTDDWADLFDLQLNLVREEPKDFRAMSAHTLSDESIWLQVSVRRLLILIRKWVVGRGMDFVFESNNERFRDGVRLQLSEALRYMFDRGAFAGAAPEQSYRIVTDASVNPPESVDAGRFVAQIQVAPSQPAEFITVLLTRVGEDLLQSREA